MIDNLPGRPDNWGQLTPEQKRATRLQWLAATPGEIRFVSRSAEKSYQTRLKRLIDVYRLMEPDRVPVAVSVGALPFTEAGIDYHTAINDYEKAVQAYARFNEKHGAALDSYAAPMIFPARVVDLLDFKLYAWPGHGVPENAAGYQFNEGEYMKGDEYDAFIKNPADFWMRTYLPRTFGAFAAMERLPPITDIIEFPIGSLAPLGRPEVQDMLKKLIAAGKEIARFGKITGAFVRKVHEKGYLTPFAMNVAHAPFDTLGDTLRGTRAIINDMFRRPARLLEALDAAADLTIDSVLKSAMAARSFRAWFPLHKGADGWMSEKQFETFYFAPLKKVMDAFINDGYIVTLFAEGSFDTRLEYFTDFPKGSIHWQFDRTDMPRAKKILGNKFSIEGNVPSSLLTTGSPADVKEHCRQLIEVCGRGGGYVLAGGAANSNPKLENLKAMVDAAKEYGVYGEREPAGEDDLYIGY